MNVLVLGATSDIAVALAHELAKPGDRYLLAGRDTQELTAICNDLQIRTQAEASAISFDATETSEHAGFVRQVRSAVAHLDGVVVAFGYLGDQARAQHELAELARIIDVNFSGAASVLEPIAAQMAEQRSGWILGLSSVAGVRGKKSNYIYGAAKAAFTTYLEGLAHRLAPSGVTVKIAKLGFVASKMTRGLAMAKWAVVSPAQAAKGISWLLRSPFQSAYIAWRWWPIMTVIRLLPARIFNRSDL